MSRLRENVPTAGIILPLTNPQTNSYNKRKRKRNNGRAAWSSAVTVPLTELLRQNSMRHAHCSETVLRSAEIVIDDIVVRKMHFQAAFDSSDAEHRTEIGDSVQDQANADKNIGGCHRVKGPQPDQQSEKCD